MKIAFIGLGHMGQPMANNLLPHYDLQVYDLMPDSRLQFKNTKAIVCDDIKNVLNNVDVVITMLPSGKEVKAAYLGTDGILKKLTQPTLLIESSTIDVATARMVHKEAEALGHAMVDAPVSGGTAGAKAASLTFMVGGSDEAFARAKPILEHMGKNIFHAGPAGNGQVAKICNNMMLGINMIGVCEAFSLAEKLGLNPETFFAIASTSSGQSWPLTSYHPLPNLVPTSPANRDYQPGFAAKMMLKDLILSQMASQETQSPTPLGALATELYMMFNQQHGEMDFSGIVEIFHKM